ncbi:MAG: ATP-binding protein [Planctomycetota bacterium]
MAEENTLHVMFVGQDAAVFAEAVDALTTAGHTVTRLASPFKALTAQTRSAADLTVVDVSRLDDQMLEAFEALKDVAPDGLLVGAVSPGTRRRAAPVLELGADAIVGSPVDPDELLALVAKRRPPEARSGGGAVEEKYRWLGDFAAGVAHHINNPLTTVVGYLQILRSHKDLPAGAESVLSIMLKECDRISDTIRNLLLLSGKASGRPDRVDVNKVVDEVLAASRPAEGAAGSGIRVERSFHPDLPPVIADEDALKLACQNLVANARQAMDGGGTLSVATADGDRRVRIRFSDTGGGIDPEQMDRIFEPFYTTQSGGAAAGLGLAAAYGIVKGLGGTIQAESRPGEGSTFTIELPAGS